MECKKGSVRKVFPGGNTSLGFHSFYDYILPQEEASRVMILKGGPGTGKSTFMRKIADEVLNRGYDVELHQCSADNDSIDGIVIPALKIALIDGTAPHVVDPKHPGIVDEIVPLGEYWDQEKLSSYKNEIFNCTKRISRMYKITYSMLAEARIAYNEWKSYISESIDTPEYNRIVRSLMDEIYKDAPKNYTAPVKHRHLFASAITPGGPKNYIDTILKPGMNVYCLSGNPGSGVKEAIGLTARIAMETGLFAEEFHCPFEPELLDMVIIPTINTVVLNTSMPFHYDVSRIEGLVVKKMINFDTCVQEEILRQYTLELDDVKERFYSLINKAVSHLRRTKSVHDELEKYYVSAMDFDRIADKREEILQRILRAAQEQAEHSFK